MIKYMQGNMLDAEVDALVNTVNTVGVMGKGIALMFKERYPMNMSTYANACKAKQVVTGKMFVTETCELMGPKWIVNFPTKQHWRNPSKLEWIVEGLGDLRQFILASEIKSIAIPPLGSGNGGLDWLEVKKEIEKQLGNINGVEIVVYEPSSKYQNVAKKKGVNKLTVPRALIAELVRRYWVLGMECSFLEVQKLAWFLERVLESGGLENHLNLQFTASNYGPYADRLRHLLEGLDGSYLKSEKRVADSHPLDVIWFDESKRERVDEFLRSDGKDYLLALNETSKIIEGFESPFGMELIATVDWLLTREDVKPDVESVLKGIEHWPSDRKWAQRKVGLFDRRAVEIALERLTSSALAIQ